MIRNPKNRLRPVSALRWIVSIWALGLVFRLLYFFQCRDCPIADFHYLLIDSGYGDLNSDRYETEPDMPPDQNPTGHNTPNTGTRRSSAAGWYRKKHKPVSGGT